MDLTGAVLVVHFDFGDGGRIPEVEALGMADGELAALGMRVGLGELFRTVTVLALNRGILDGLILDSGPLYTLGLGLRWEVDTRAGSSVALCHTRSSQTQGSQTNKKQSSGRL